MVWTCTEYFLIWSKPIDQFFQNLMWILIDFWQIFCTMVSSFYNTEFTIRYKWCHKENFLRSGFLSGNSSPAFLFNIRRLLLTNPSFLFAVFVRIYIIEFSTFWPVLAEVSKNLQRNLFDSSIPSQVATSEVCTCYNKYLSLISLINFIPHKDNWKILKVEFLGFFDLLQKEGNISESLSVCNIVTN